MVEFDPSGAGAALHDIWLTLMSAWYRIGGRTRSWLSRFVDEPGHHARIDHLVCDLVRTHENDAFYVPGDA